jgi:hypothetical protein
VDGTVCVVMSDCLRQYIAMKLQAREVDEDQLVCPVVECRAAIDERDLVLVAGSDTAAQVQLVRQRKLVRVVCRKRPRP